MPIRVDQAFISRGNTLLNDLWDEVAALDQAPICTISECIDHVLAYNKAKTYKYILLTQLLGKAVDDRVNTLAMKASSSLPGAWDARNLCEGVITRGGFEKNVLRGILGESKQPYNSSPGQKAELSRSNRTRPSDIPLRDELIDALEQITSSQDAIAAIRYYLYVCEEQLEQVSEEEPLPEFSNDTVSLARTRQFWRALARVGREGEGLSLAVATLLEVSLDDSFRPVLYQINTSRAGHGDLDLYRGADAFATLEIKDRPFTAHEVHEYAGAAFSSGWGRFAFVYGYRAGDAGQVFTEHDYAEFVDRGVIAVCLSFESFLDSVLLQLVSVSLDDLRRHLVAYIEDAKVSAQTANSARQLLRNLVSEVHK
ncbi:restriction endonuclease, SacI family [Actinomyces sp.]|uniref:restriction endonuclease, SacI family n=1 Tax=Actinomyces sp. TaxID=29317 RepID=UPI0026DB94E8|nr:restriction endonuclease, SacI family [Actinomyces sp.]MDO4900120.1 restriction endonuclease, SacI family [Actinomyces sp.]